MAREVRALPLVGRAFHEAGHITVGPDWLERCCERLRQNHALGIFPEGRHTYSDQLRPFHSGIAVLARASQAPVLPVALVGNHAYLSSRATYLKGGPVQVRIGEPLYCRPDEPVEAFNARLHAAVAELIETPEKGEPWRPNTPYRLAQIFWVPVSRALFALIDHLKPDNLR